MTLERAAELYRTASTLPEVLELLRMRPGRAKEVHLLESLEASAQRDPMVVITVLRGLATSDEEAIRRMTEKTPQTERDHRSRRREALLWAASALTRGMALRPRDTP